MYQSAYLPLQSIGRIRVPYVGGFCRWWYTPIENIAVFPAIDPVTQMLAAEPELKAGANWYGPVNVPDSHTGWDEEMQQGKPGHWYKEKVEGLMPGMDRNSHINLQNHAFHQFVIVGKARSGGNFYLIGSDVSGLDLNLNSTTGAGAAGTPATKLAFTGESIDRALILPSFAPANALAPPGSSGGSTGGGTTPGTVVDDIEIITFINVNSVLVDYNSTRRNRFGDFPSIEVWLFDAAANSYYKDTSCEILVDAAPPNQTGFTVRPGQNSTGFIILS